MTGTVGSPYLTNWLSQGYAIVATDYVGLGTPGIHAYLDGPSAAHSVIDMVRAARAVEPSLSPLSTAIVSSTLAAIYGAFCGHGFSPRTAR